MSRHVIYVPVGRSLIIATPKVGNTTIRAAAGHHAQCPASAVPLYDRVIALIRDPIERLESCFNYFTEYDNWPRGRAVGYPKTIEEFVNAVLDEPWLDKHWRAQTDLWGVEPTEIHPFERLDEVLRDLGLHPSRENASKAPKRGVTYRLPELEHYYEKDLRVREEAIACFSKSTPSPAP